jgi:hypothetical protein
MRASAQPFGCCTQVFAGLVQFLRSQLADHVADSLDGFRMAHYEKIGPDLEIVRGRDGFPGRARRAVGPHTSANSSPALASFAG